MTRQGGFAAELGRALAFSGRVAGVGAAIALVMLGAMIAGAFAIAVAVYGGLRPAASGLPGHGGPPGIRAVDSPRPAEVPMSHQPLPESRA